MEAVDALTTFASSPQFASTPAKISSKARQAQEPILQAGRNVNQSSNSLLTSAKNLVINPNDPPMWQLLASHTKAVTDAIKSLILAIRDKCPGQKECDNAIDCLNENIRDLDQAILAAMSQQLPAQASSTLQVGVACDGFVGGAYVRCVSSLLPPSYRASRSRCWSSPPTSTTLSCPSPLLLRTRQRSLAIR